MFASLFGIGGDVGDYIHMFLTRIIFVLKTKKYTYFPGLKNELSFITKLQLILVLQLSLYNF